MTSVLIVDDHEGIRFGLQALIDEQPDLEVCGVAGLGETALQLAPTVCPDVVIMDLSMPGMGGIAAIESLRDVCPDAKVLVLTWYDDADLVQAALDAGATGYMLKADVHADLLESVRKVARLETAMSEKVKGLYRSDG